MSTCSHSKKKMCSRSALSVFMDDMETTGEHADQGHQPGLVEQLQGTLQPTAQQGNREARFSSALSEYFAHVDTKKSACIFASVRPSVRASVRPSVRPSVCQSLRPSG